LAETRLKANTIFARKSNGLFFAAWQYQLGYMSLIRRVTQICHRYSRRKRSFSAGLTARLLLIGALVAGGIPVRGVAKGYSSGGGHSYSSSSHSSSSGGSHSSSGGSSHSSSSGGSKSFSSGSGKSYSSGSSSSGERKGYTSGKSYTSGSGHAYSSKPASGSAGQTTGTGNSGVKPPPPSTPAAPDKPSPPIQRFSDSTVQRPPPSTPPSAASAPSTFTFDSPAARARKQQASQQEFTRFKESSKPRPATPDGAPSPSYRVTPPPLPPSASGNYRRPDYVPDRQTIWTRPARSYTVFYPYVSRPVVVYRDPYDSFFWWWLLDRTLDDRAYWAYHHRYDMDPARYQALVAENQQLESRIAQLETQQVPRDPNYVPPGLDRDLMYSDKHVTQAYSNRPTLSGRIAFWAVAIPLATGAGCLFIWLIFFKRWQPATT